MCVCVCVCVCVIGHAAEVIQPITTCALGLAILGRLQDLDPSELIFNPASLSCVRTAAGEGRGGERSIEYRPHAAVEDRG